MGTRALWAGSLVLALVAVLLWQVLDLRSEVLALRRAAHEAGEASPGLSAAAAPPSAGPPGREARPGPELQALPPATAAAPDARVAALERSVQRLEAQLAEAQAASARVEALAGPLLARMLDENHAAALATGRNVNSALAQLQAMARIDEDRDGTGEFGGFLELSGAVAGRMAQPLNPPVMSRAFAQLSPGGEASRAGYLFRIYLPDARGQGVGEPATGFAPGMVDANLAETTWCMYAWPQAYGSTGTRTYFTSQAGDVLWCDSAAYSGPGKGPAPEAAFRPGGRAGITGQPAVGATGNDGNAWKQGG